MCYQTTPAFFSNLGPLHFVLMIDIKRNEIVPTSNLTSFATRVAVFRHRIAAHVMPSGVSLSLIPSRVMSVRYVNSNRML